MGCGEGVVELGMGEEGVVEGMGGGETVLTTGVGVVEDSLVG